MLVKISMAKGRVKIYRVPGPGPSTGGRRLFSTKKKGGEDFFSENIRGAKTFFRLKKGGRRLFFRQIFPKTRPRYPVNFDRSLIIMHRFQSLGKKHLSYHFKNQVIGKAEQSTLYEQIQSLSVCFQVWKTGKFRKFLLFRNGLERNA